MRTTRGAGVVVAALLILFGAGCSETTEPADISSSPSASATSEPSASVSTTEPAESEEDAVIAAYKGFFEALYSASDLREQHVRAALEPFGTGPAVDNLVQVAALLDSKGQQPGGSVVFNEINVDILPTDTASVVECRDTSTETIVSTADGATVSAGVPGTKFETELLKLEGTWKVSSYNAVEGAC